MKIVFIQDVSGVGRKNEVKDVSDGYARNFLFPRNLAKPATGQVLKTLAIQKTREEREKSEEYQKYKVLAGKLKSLTLTFELKLGKENRAFGSVTVVKIRDALKKHGIEAEKDWILLEQPIKNIGEQVVKINFPHDLTGDVKIFVESE